MSIKRLPCFRITSGSDGRFQQARDFKKYKHAAIGKTRNKNKINVQ
jgi:hypothetical protein